MIYNLEAYYINDSNLSEARIELEVARIVSRWAKGYSARLIAPKKGVHLTVQEDSLPGDLKKKETVIADIVRWIHNNSVTNNVFKLILHKDYPPPSKREVALFDHHDTSSDWVLNISEDQFGVLQDELVKTGLPADLFYDADKMITVPAKIFGFIPFGDYWLSPKQYEARQRNK